MIFKTKKKIKDLEEMLETQARAVSILRHALIDAAPKYKVSPTDSGEWSVLKKGGIKGVDIEYYPVATFDTKELAIGAIKNLNRPSVYVDDKGNEVGEV